MRSYLLTIIALSLIYLQMPIFSQDKKLLDEFKIKRESVFEFESKPKISRNGDSVTIEFTTKSFCDVTVAIENTDGNIVCHLASGVLGSNAPLPFQKDSKQQKIVWDGKNDSGVYLNDKNSLVIRVSLGLKAQFEKPLFWEPKKRISQVIPQIRANEEGVFVFEGFGTDHLRFYDREGNYVRTVYPFSATKLNEVQGLDWYIYPQDEKKLPLKKGTQETTLLTSGTSGIVFHSYKLGNGVGAYAMDVRNKQIALAGIKLNRLSTDGTSGGNKIYGPDVYALKQPNIKFDLQGPTWVPPTSLAFSPDAKWLYLAGYSWPDVGCHPGVMRMEYNSEKSPEIFVGAMDLAKSGSEDNQFKCATSVDCDSEGRVYVTDYMNDRIQIYSPEAKLLKSISTPKPALVRIHRKTNEIYCFSWGMMNQILTPPAYGSPKVKPTLIVFGAFANPEKINEISLPIPEQFSYVLGHGAARWPVLYTAEIDSWSTPTTIWLGKEAVNNQTFGVASGNGGQTQGYTGRGIQIFKINKDKLEKISDFGEDAAKSIVRTKPPAYMSQKLYVNPKNHKLYVAEGNEDTDKSTNELLEIDPDSGKINIIKLPFAAEDLCFDLEGMIYLRTHTEVARFDPNGWRDVPWDYGEERSALAGTKIDANSVLVLPAEKPVTFHQNGMWINPKGHLTISCTNYMVEYKKNIEGNAGLPKSKGVKGKYLPQLYAGRARWNEIHIWDKHGKIIYEDAFPGLHIHEGLAIDKNDNLYAMASAYRTGYFNQLTGTLIKASPKKAIIYTDGTELQLSSEAKPKRPQDMRNSWIEKNDWLYGGVGFMGQNFPAPTTCDCCRTRFTLDLFDRPFAPEIGHHSVAVLDTNGNLILRIGQYGNESDGKPLVPNPLIKNPTSIGGDEVAIFYNAYLATDTDKRLFLADIGNSRITSVKLDYHANEIVSLKEVASEQK